MAADGSLTQILAIALQGISITGVFRGGIGWGHVPEVVMAYGPEPITLLLKVSSQNYEVTVLHDRN